VPKSVVGTSCGEARECNSGNCVDYVCCDKPCSGSCQACDVAGRAGTCSTVTGAPHGTRTCPAGPDGCPGTCDGTSPACAVGTCDAGADADADGATPPADAGSEAGDDGSGGDGASDGGTTSDGGSDGSAAGDSTIGGPTADAGDLAPNENGGCACRAAPSSHDDDSPLGVMMAIGAGLATIVVRRRRR